MSQSAHSSQQDLWRQLNEYLLYAFVLIGVFLGGAPNSANWRIMAIAALASVLIPVAIAGGALDRFRMLSRPLRLTLIAVPLIPLLQLIPMPAGIYSALPGRDLAVRVFDLIGAGNSWRPLSLVPRDTLLVFAMMLAPAASFLATLVLDKDGRRRTIQVFLVAAILSILIGVVQFGTKGSSLDFYDTAHRGSLLGFFANRNHQGLLIAIAGVFALSAVKVYFKDRTMALSVSALLALVFLIAAIGTLSRAGIGLTVIGLAAAGIALHLRRVPRWPILATGGAVVFSGIYFLGFSSTVQQAVDRFSQVEENGRWEIWQKTIPLLEQYFPAGAGMGSFTTVYPPIEQLEDVNPLYFNRMHNDYLELLVEAGLPGLLVVGLLLGLVGMRFLKLAQSKVQLGTHALAGGIVILLVALHSIVDYPLRTQSVAIVFGLALALFFASENWTAQTSNEPTPSSWNDRSMRFSALKILAQIISVLGFSLFAQYQFLLAQPSGATKTILVNSDEPALGASELANAKRLLARHPLDQSRLNEVYATEVRNGADENQRRDYVSVLEAMGWRDTATQQNLLFEAALRNDIDGAVDHMDALLRREKLGDQIMPLLTQLEVDPEGSRIVAERLVRSPSWRGRYFDFGGPLTNPEILDARVRLLNIMKQQGEPVTRNELRVTLGALIQAGKRKEVVEIAKGRMPESERDQLLYDQNFDRLISVSSEDRQRPIAYEWRPTDTPGVSVQIVVEEWGSRLAVRWNGRGAPNFARALTFLKEGQQPTMELVLSDGNSQRVLDQIGFTLFCPFVGGVRMLPDATTPNSGSDRRSAKYSAEASIPCDYPDIMINGRPQVGDRSADLSIDSIKLTLP